MPWHPTSFDSDCGTSAHWNDGPNNDMPRQRLYRQIEGHSDATARCVCAMLVSL